MSKFVELLGEELGKQVEEKLGEGFFIGKEENYVAKHRFDEVNTELKEVKEQLKERDKDLAELKDSLKDNEELQNKVKEWEIKYQEAVQNSEKKIAEMQKRAAVEKALTGAKYPDLLIEKIDFDKLTIEGDKVIGLNDVIEGLKENYADLFGSKEIPPAGDDFKGGGGGNLDDLGKMDMESYIKARQKKE